MKRTKRQTIRELLIVLSTGKKIVVNNVTFNTFMNYVEEHGIAEHYKYKSKKDRVFIQRR